MVYIEDQNFDCFSDGIFPYPGVYLQTVNVYFFTCVGNTNYPPFTLIQVLVYHSTMFAVLAYLACRYYTNDLLDHAYLSISKRLLYLIFSTFL